MKDQILYGENTTTVDMYKWNLQVFAEKNEINFLTKPIDEICDIMDEYCKKMHHSKFSILSGMMYDPNIPDESKTYIKIRYGNVL